MPIWFDWTSVTPIPRALLPLKFLCSLVVWLVRFRSWNRGKEYQKIRNSKKWKRRHITFLKAWIYNTKSQPLHLWHGFCLWTHHLFVTLALSCNFIFPLQCYGSIGLFAGWFVDILELLPWTLCFSFLWLQRLIGPDTSCDCTQSS